MTLGLCAGTWKEVIRALAGHVDIRTTQLYVDVTDQRKADGLAALERTRHPLAAKHQRQRQAVLLRRRRREHG
jgi:hypothetical protein